MQHDIEAKTAGNRYGDRKKFLRLERVDDDMVTDVVEVLVLVVKLRSSSYKNTLFSLQKLSWVNELTIGLYA